MYWLPSDFFSMFCVYFFTLVQPSLVDWALKTTYKPVLCLFKKRIKAVAKINNFKHFFFSCCTLCVPAPTVWNKASPIILKRGDAV